MGGSGDARGGDCREGGGGRQQRSLGVGVRAGLVGVRGFYCRRYLYNTTPSLVVATSLNSTTVSTGGQLSIRQPSRSQSCLVEHWFTV